MDLPFISNEYILNQFYKNRDIDGFIKYIKNPIEPFDCSIKCSYFLNRNTDILEAILECYSFSDDSSFTINTDNELYLLSQILEKHKISRLCIMNQRKLSKDTVLNFVPSLCDVQEFSCDFIGHLDIIISSLVDSKSIKSLDLSFNDIDEKAINAFNDLLLNNTSLKSIDLTNSNMGKILEPLKDCIIKNTTLVNVNISQENSTGPLINGTDCMEIISEIISKNKSIKNLKMNGHMIDKETKSTFTECLKNNTTIKRLEMNDVYLETTSEIVNIIRENRTLCHLRIHDMILKSDAKELSNALRENTVLYSLHIDASDKDKIEEIIRGTINISDLSLYNTKSESMSGICKVLGNHKHLRSLYIRNFAQMTDINAIAEMLDQNKTLELFTVKLSTVDGIIDSLVKILAENKTLTSLYIESDIISDSNARKILHALKNNRTMSNIVFSYNNWSEMKEEIYELFKVNRTLISIGKTYTMPHQLVDYLKRNKTLRDTRDKVVHTKQ
jgi:Ran GTPase-activating protein (RanGAP) involved in mRNA processing and transport